MLSCFNSFNSYFPSSRYICSSAFEELKFYTLALTEEPGSCWGAKFFLVSVHLNTQLAPQFKKTKLEIWCRSVAEHNTDEYVQLKKKAS